MKAQNRLKNLRRQYEQLLIACELYQQAAERRVARSQIRQHTLDDIIAIRAELARLVAPIEQLPLLPPEEPLERALHGPLLKVRTVLKPLYDRIEALPELAPDENDGPREIRDAACATAAGVH